MSGTVDSVDSGTTVDAVDSGTAAVTGIAVVSDAVSAAEVVVGAVELSMVAGLVGTAAMSSSVDGGAVLSESRTSVPAAPESSSLSRRTDDEPADPDPGRHQRER